VEEEEEEEEEEEGGREGEGQPDRMTLCGGRWWVWARASPTSTARSPPR
jgi:hypothetical protein